MPRAGADAMQYYAAQGAGPPRGAIPPALASALIPLAALAWFWFWRSNTNPSR